MNRYTLSIAMLLSIGLLSTIPAFAVTKTSTGSGNWNAAIWSPSGTPGAGDDVIIASGHTVTVNVAASCLSVTVEGGSSFSAASSLNINSGITLTVSGAVIIGAPGFVSGNRSIAVGAGTLSCSSVSMGDPGFFAGDCILSISTGTATVTGSISMAGSSTENYITFLGAGTLNIGGSISGGTITPATGTVNYNSAAAQTIADYSYYSLRISGGGAKTLSASKTIEGTLTLTSGNLNLGANSLTIAASGSISGGSSSSYVATNGTGSLVRNGIGTSAAAFPIGTGSSYNPVTIATGTGTDNFSARVVGSVSPPSNDDDAAVQRTWILSEETVGGNGTIAFTVQWNSGEEGGTFVYTSCDGWTYTTRWKRMVGSLGLPLPGPTFPRVATIATTSLSSWTVANTTGALPIQLTSFTGVQTGSNTIRLDWSTISEINNYGFFVQRRAGHETEFTELPNSFVPGAGTTNVPQYYSFTDENVTAGVWFYRLKQVDLDNTVHYIDPIQVGLLTSAKESAPIEFALLQNYPNPFNPSTEIKFSVDATTHTTLDVYNIVGQRVATLFNDVAEAGQYYRVKLDGSQLPSGVYFYRLHNEKKSELRKMMLLK